jgi:hypothetical protein
MTIADEATLSTGLVELAPSTAFIDGQRWPSLEPPLRGSIASCEGREVYVWNRQLSPNLPTVPLAGGGVQGPISGPVIEFTRSLLDGDELLSGRIAAGFAADDEERLAYVERVWKLVKSVTVPVDGLTGVPFDHRLGFDAMRWYMEAPGPKWTQSNQGHRLRDRAVLSLYLRPRHTNR